MLTFYGYSAMCFWQESRVKSRFKRWTMCWKIIQSLCHMNLQFKSFKWYTHFKLSTHEQFLPSLSQKLVTHVWLTANTECIRCSPINWMNFDSHIPWKCQFQLKSHNSYYISFWNYFSFIVFSCLFKHSISIEFFFSRISHRFLFFPRLSAVKTNE